MIEAYIKIIYFLTKDKNWKTTTEIRKFLEKKGILNGTYENNRRKLRNYLKKLKYLGYIEEDDSQKPSKWKIAPKSILDELIYLNEKEKNALLLTLSFIPKIYQHAEFLAQIKNILEKSNVEINETTEKIIKNAFLYIPNFTEKSFDLSFTDAEKIIEDILNQRFTKIWYKNRSREILPLKVIFYEGILYLLARERQKDGNLVDRTYRINCLKRIEASKETENILYYQNIATFPFNYIEEKEPFIFAVELPNYYIKCDTEEKYIEKYKIIQTQFHIELTDRETLKVYAIGFPSHRFYAHFSYLEIKRIYSPDREMFKILNKNIEKYKEHLRTVIGKERLKEVKNLDLQSAKIRFEKFKKGFKEFLNSKLEIL